MLAAMLFLGITATSAQEIRDMFGTDQKGEIAYGVRAGLNISNIGGKYGPAQDLDHNSRVGFQFGGVVDLPMEEIGGYKDKYRPMYLQIPVLGSFRADVSQSVNVQVNVGPHFAFGLGGKEVYDDGETTVKSPFFGKSTDDEGHFGAKRFDFGLTFGAGVTFKEHYYVGIAYDLGLVNMAIEDEWGKEAKFHNRNFSIQIGYNF